MADRYGTYSDSASSPARRSTPIVPGDGTLDPAPKAILVGTAGNVVGQLLDDTADRTFPLGTGYHPLRFKIIRASSTAANMIGLD